MEASQDPTDRRLAEGARAVRAGSCAAHALERPEAPGSRPSQSDGALGGTVPPRLVYYHRLSYVRLTLYYDS